MKITYPKLIILKSQWYRDLCTNGHKPHVQQTIADRTGIAKSNISATLNGNLVSKTFQESISDETGIPVARLFGDHAWFKRVARQFRELESKQLALNTN